MRFFKQNCKLNYFTNNLKSMVCMAYLNFITEFLSNNFKIIYFIM